MDRQSRQTLWQRQARKWFMNPVSGVLALIAVVIVATAALVVEEARQAKARQLPILFGPR
jgi:hypothetical protein